MAEMLPRRKTDRLVLVIYDIIHFDLLLRPCLLTYLLIITNRLMAEMKDKEYLQECLDETGNILFQLKNNERKLQDDREILLDDLEQEQEVRTSSSVI